MSFWTDLVLARSAPPPLVTASAIGVFLRNLAATGALVGGDELVCEIKYGLRVDADDRTTDVIERDESGIISTYLEYPWDVSETFRSINVLADRLAADGRSVYRASLSLGELHSDIVAALTREGSEGNGVELCLSSLCFYVGPVLVAGVASESQALVGWLGLFISGPGYRLPWEYRHLRERAEAVGLIHHLQEVCRAAWPVPPAPASAEVIANRRKLGELWLYDDLALPQDWLWFVSGSG